MSEFSATPLTPLSREPLCLQVARHLREVIVNGDVGDGAVVPSEKQLAAQLGVGRSTIREALRILQAQGLISGGDSVSTRQPTVTSNGVVPSAAVALENALLLNQVPYADMLALRVLIEQQAVRLAAQRRDPAALAAAADALDRMRLAGADVEAFHQADVDFHEALLAGSGNVAFSLTMDVLRGAAASLLLRALEAEDDLPGVTDALLDEHRAIFRAVQSGDADTAAALVADHIQRFYERRLP